MTDEEKRAKKIASKREYYLKNAVAIRAKAAEYRLANPEKVAACKKACKEKKPELYAALDKEYAANNKERLAAYRKEYAEKNSASIKANNKIYYEANKEQHASRRLAYAQRTKDARNTYKKQWAIANKEKTLVATREYYQRNKEASRDRKALYRAAKPWVLHASSRRRQVGKLQRTPPWYDHTNTAAVYAKLTPGYHVDHIIPLQGELVSGLHWHYNLQILTAEENLKKSNKFDPDTYVHELPDIITK